MRTKEHAAEDDPETAGGEEKYRSAAEEIWLLWEEERVRGK